MATQLFFIYAPSSGPADTHLGTDNVNLRSTAVPWVSFPLSTSRGAVATGVISTTTITGPTPGVEHDFTGIAGTTPIEWISPPVAADVTIAGTITANIWAAESGMNANVAINVVVDVIRANATATRNSNTIVEIGRSANVTEVAISTTTAAVNNFTFTPTSTVVNRGDRLRVRLFADDVGTMASGFDWYISYNGPTAAADGDSYVSFTENFSFEGPLTQSDTFNTTFFGWTGAQFQMVAQPFTAQGTLTEVRAWLSKSGTPTDNAVLEIQTDSSGDPSGSVVGTVATVAAASLTTTKTQYTYSCSIALTASTTYWLVFRRDGSLDSTNYFQTYRSSAAIGGWTQCEQYSGSAWVPATTWAGAAHSLAVALTFAGGSTLYLTDTASDVSTASADLEAWTSRGGSSVPAARTLVAGWTAPLQLQRSGTVADWFTKPLTAFTLGGMAVANLSAGQGNLAGNASLRVEIARVDGDGTNPTVWSSWCIAPTGTDDGELDTSFVARTAYLSGDDLAFTDGQRIRIRVYTDDISSAAMTAISSADMRFGGPTPAATGDTYITLPQTVTEAEPPELASLGFGLKSL